MHFYLALGVISVSVLLSQKIELLSIIPAVLVLRFVKFRKLILFLSVLLSCYFGLLTRLVTVGRPQAQDLIHNLATGPAINTFVSNLLALFATIAITFAITKVIKFLKLSHFKSIFVLTVISFFWIYLFSLYTKGGEVNEVVSLTTILYFRLFGLWLLIVSYNDFAIKNINDYLYILPPIWDTAACPRPEVKILESKKSRNDLDKEAWRIALLFAGFIVVSLIAKTLFFKNDFYGINLVFFPLLNLDLSMAYESGNIISTQVVLFSIFVTGIIYLGGYLAWVLVVDVCYRVLGFEPSRQFIFPFKSNSAGEFFANIMPYYSYSLNFVFLFPIYKRFRNLITLKDLSYSISLFISIFLYDYLFHVTLDIAYFIEYDFFSVLQNQFFSIVPHSVLIFLMIRFIKLPKKNHIWYYKPLLYMLVVFNLGLMIVFRFQPMKITIFQKMQFLKALFL